MKRPDLEGPQVKATMILEVPAGALEDAAQLRRPEEILEPVIRPPSECGGGADGSLPQPIGRREHEMATGLHDAIELEHRLFGIRRVLDSFTREHRVERARRQAEGGEGADDRFTAAAASGGGSQ